MILAEEWLSSETIHLTSDSARNSGFGAYLGSTGDWFNSTWKAAGVREGHSMTYLELFPITLAMLVWGDKLANSKLILHCDNLGVVGIINKQSSRCPHIMSLLRKLVLTCLKHNIMVRSCYINTKANIVSDALSRFQWARFAAAAPNASKVPSAIRHLLPLN